MRDSLRHQEDARRYLIRAAEATLWDGGRARPDDRLASAIVFAALALMHLAKADANERALAIVQKVLEDVAAYKRQAASENQGSSASK